MIEFVTLTPEAWEWMYERSRPILTKNTRGVFAMRNGEYLAGVVFDTWMPTSAQVHVLIENPIVLRHGFLEEVFNYFFNAAERELLIGVTPTNNEKALKFNKHIGFKQTYRIKDGYDFGVDLVVQELRKADCRWINHERT